MKKREIMRIARAFLKALHAVPEKDREGAIPAFLAELQRTHNLPDGATFLRALERTWSEVFGARTVQLTSAHRIPAELKEHLAQVLPHAELKAVIDPRLLGGAILRVDDRVIDSSITGTLDRMKKTLLAR